MVRGLQKHQPMPMARHFTFSVVEVDRGNVVATAVPTSEHYNPFSRLQWYSLVNSSSCRTGYFCFICLLALRSSTGRSYEKKSISRLITARTMRPTVDACIDILPKGHNLVLN